MNAKELYNLNDNGEYKPTGVYYCTKCNHAAFSKKIAEQCCQPKLCECGKEMHQYWTVCEECSDRLIEERELKNFTDNLKYTNEEYDDEIFINDTFYESIDEYLNDNDVGVAAHDIHGYTAIHETYHVNVDNVIDVIHEWATDNIEDPELVELKGVDKLRDALEEFNNAQTGYMITPNEKEGVLYTKEYLQELKDKML
jgi:hypothetical protein